jgi:hypothetical protein
MSKPDWDKTAGWASYIAQDCDGTWCAYEEMPKPIKTGWIQEFGTKCEDGDTDELNENWLQTLEQRP